RNSAWIQEFVVTVREERYCIPVKSEYVKAFGGIAHDVSQSGATVFVEPSSTVPLGNELKQMRAQQQQEIQRILRELTRLVAASAEALLSLVSIAGHLDLVHAKAQLAAEMDATEPAVNVEARLRYIGARHPLLPDPVTPIDIELGQSYKTLLITGPNTGGKTAALKTVGLLSLMLQAGLQIPAGAGSEATVFPAIFADIGDEQDLRQSLSTFSAHLKNITAILHDIEPCSLVLLDEIGAGTDPAEGAALARAILNALLAQQALTIATSHYGELKEYAYRTPGVLNASVEFDRDTLSPTYHILPGTPGSSHAFHIAARLGMPQELIEQARGSLSKRDQDAGQLLEQIESARRATRSAQVEAERDRDAAADLRSAYEERVRQATELRAGVQAEARAEARQLLQQTRTRAEALLKQIEKRGAAPVRGRAPQQSLERLETETWSDFAREAPAPPEPEETGGNSEPLRKGDTVRVTTLNLDGQLLEDPVNGQAALIIGAMRVTLPLGQLRRLAKPEAKQAARKAASDRPSDGAREIAMRKALTIAPELMLRAMRVEDALPLLDKYLDDAFAAGMHTARIIHGKGTGVLRRVVSEQLREHPLVESYRLGESSEGGEGATVVVFKT
ncbi:MAG: Smr/MutS family protein, partial [Armatimonadetes bacterium]|nr:Smr/MutS family protein [Armatimonadota bacterium]